MPQGGLTFVLVQHVLSRLKKPMAAITCSALSVAHTFAGTACRACRSAQRPNVTQFEILEIKSINLEDLTIRTVN